MKAINQFYNKRRAYLQSRLPANRHTSRQLDAIIDKRNRQINDYLHNSSRAVINLLIQEGIAALVIGKNDLWKQGINLGSRTNQNFVLIPPIC